MPEGHTIHRIARDHRKNLSGQSLRLSSPQGRFRSAAKRLNGHVLHDVEAFGKHLFYCWDDALTVHVHLGLYGRFRRHPVPPPKPRGAVRWRLIGTHYAFDLHGPTACEIVTPQQRSRILARLGPDPLRGDAEPERAWERIRRSRSAVGKLLLDQSVMAGVGNVYRCELLHAHAIHPERAGYSLSRSEFDALWQTLVRWFKIGVRYNRIITTASAGSASPGHIRRGERLRIYKKTHCPQCEWGVRSWELGNRTIYACEQCQS